MSPIGSSEWENSTQSPACLVEFGGLNWSWREAVTLTIDLKGCSQDGPEQAAQNGGI